MSSFMEDKDHSHAAGGSLADVSQCLGTLGKPAFLEPFFDLLKSTATAQIMIFSYRDNHAQCLLSRNFIEGGIGKRLAADYLDDWFLQDPLYTRIMALDGGSFETHRLKDVLPEVSQDYRRRFFDDPSIEDKTTVLSVSKQRLAISFYWQTRCDTSPDLLNIAARLVQLHFDALAPSSEPPALQVLSARERDICLGMLAGKKAELIGHELDIKPTSVATYRQRAYEKLGINSRGELFAICRT
ncbi:helix-turn-helix transcriptional regulator [Roseibium aggregatum]|uniref:Helix-turn-helix transcriptional regulator n=1 Tax=Roseibium aggregatum TaxID=187304 RepID=A0A926P1T3_9HYPH|nr:helix-turn-helix transcriptional regulator [Roseibium aggregatum]MBD1547908.1 helix-turn-helix transcriptional regulator [Roseibium aggregatum]